MGQTMTKTPAPPTLQELSTELDRVERWYELGVNLDFPGHQLREIEQDSPRCSSRCKLEMLDKWLRKSENPSWEAVAKALYLMKEYAVANQIRKKYCSSANTSDLTPVWQSKSSLGASAVPSSYSSSSLSSAGSHMNDSLALAKENLEKIRGKFASLIALAGSVLQGKDIDMSNLQLFLTAHYLPVEDDNDTRAIDPSRFISQVFGNARSVSKVLQSLMIHNLLNFKNFKVLRSIINHYASGDIEMKTKLDEYEQQLAGYILVTKMNEYLNAELKPSEETKPDLKLLNELSIKVKASVTEKTLKYVNELWDSLVYQVKLPVTALLFHRVAEGCIEITWLLPFHLTLFTTRRLQESTDYFREKSILSVTIDGKCVYQEMPPVQEETNTGRKGDQDDPDSGNLTSLQDDQDHSQQLTGYEREGPEDIPEHEQGLKCGRVICTNYSLLYGHLDPEKLLPKLPEKDLISENQLEAAESVHQKFAKNVIIIRVLFWHDRPSHGLLKFCDTLETIPGQEHLGKKLLACYKHPPPVHVHCQSEATAIHSNLTETSQLFQQLQREVMDMLDHFPNALAKLKQVLASLVLPISEEGKVVPLVDSLSYKSAETIQELFRRMVLYWNPLSTDLLGLLLEASGYNQAARKVTEFVEARASKDLVLCISTCISASNLDVADLETVHNAPLSELRSLHSAVFVQLPEYEAISSQGRVRISVEVNKPFLCIADYEEITTALSGFFQVPKAALVYAGCFQAPLVLCWLAPNALALYIVATGCGLLLMTAHRLLAENKVTRIAVGYRTYRCPTIKEVELWEACQYGRVEQVFNLLMNSVSVNMADFDGFFALYIACEKGYDRIVEMLLEAGAIVNLQTRDGRTPLYAASQDGHLSVIQLLIAAKADVNHQREDGTTPLYMACQNGHLPVAEYLIAAKADVNTPTMSDVTPLWIACQNGHLPVVQHLTARKANVNHPDENGLTPLYIACEKGHLPVVEHMIAAKANVNTPTHDGTIPLWIACQNGHLPVVQYLIAANADVNHPDEEILTPLYIACEKGHLSVVEHLITAKADVNIPTQSGATALMAAAQWGHPSVVRVLLQAQAATNTTARNGSTALILASCSGHPSVVRVLLQAGATVNTTNHLGWTALHAAVANKHDEIVELLLDAKINPDLPDRHSQETALMMATKQESEGIVRKLIQHGASVNLTNKSGMTSLYMACQEGNFQVVKCLIAARAAVNHQRKGGGTSLYIACRMGHTVIVEHLIAAKANVNHQRKNGATALMVAADFGHSSVVRVLLQARAATNITMQSGWTALHFAVDSEHEDIVDLLLKAETDPDLPKKPSQETALMMAARKGSVRIVRKLIQHKASVNLTNKNGDTAFDIARAKGHVNVCEELLAQKSS